MQVKGYYRIFLGSMVYGVRLGLTRLNASGRLSALNCLTRSQLDLSTDCPVPLWAYELGCAITPRLALPRASPRSHTRPSCGGLHVLASKEPCRSRFRSGKFDPGSSVLCFLSAGHELISPSGSKLIVFVVQLHSKQVSCQGGIV